MAQNQGGMAAIFLDEQKTVAAAIRCRESGLKKFDAISPYPIHAMEEAIGIKRSPLPYVAFVGGLVGMVVGLAFTIWTSAYDWPINVGGKPFVSLPAFIPIVFELTILFSALSSLSAFAWFCRLPKIDPPMIDPDLSSHKFAIYVPSDDHGYDANKLEQMFKELGAVEVKKVAVY